MERIFLFSLFFQSFAKRKTFVRDISSRFPSSFRKERFPTESKVGRRPMEFSNEKRGTLFL